MLPLITGMNAILHCKLESLSYCALELTVVCARCIVANLVTVRERYAVLYTTLILHEISM